MATHKVDGFNNKEQRCFNRLLDGEPHDIRELKKSFWKDAEARCKEVWEKPSDHEVNGQAQSFARNSLRRLIRDGWVEKSTRGTYRLTRTGKSRIEKGVDTTCSKTNSQRGKGGGAPKKTTKKAAPKKKAVVKAKATNAEIAAKAKAKAKTKTKAKAKTKTKAKAKTKTKAKAKTTTKKTKTQKAKGNGVSKKEVSTDKVKKMKAKTKVAVAKEKFADQKEAN